MCSCRLCRISKRACRKRAWQIKSSIWIAASGSISVSDLESRASTATRLLQCRACQQKSKQSIASGQWSLQSAKLTLLIGRARRQCYFSVLSLPKGAEVADDALNSVFQDECIPRGPLAEHHLWHCCPCLSPLIPLCKPFHQCDSMQCDHVCRA